MPHCCMHKNPGFFQTEKEDYSRKKYVIISNAYLMHTAMQISKLFTINLCLIKFSINSLWLDSLAVQWLNCTELCTCKYTEDS